MITVIQMALPIYLLIAAGFATVRSGYLPADTLTGIGQFALKVCLPVLIFAAVSKPGGLWAVNWGLILGYAAASLCVIIIVAVILAKVFGMAPAPSAILGLGAGSSNSAFLGLPVATIVLGPEEAVLIFASILMAENLIVIPLCVSMAETAGQPNGSFIAALRAVLKGMVRSPLMIGLVAGLALSVTGIVLPEALSKTMGMVVTTAPVLSLMLVGGFIAHQNIGNAGVPSGLICAAKLVLHPVAVYLTLSALPGLDHRMVLGGTVYAAMPMFTIYTLFAARHQAETIASTSLVITTVAAIVTMNIMLFLVVGAL